jgi:hypothetical protein
MDFSRFHTFFLYKIDDIFSSSGSNLMQDSVLEALLVVDYMIEI